MLSASLSRRHCDEHSRADRVRRDRARSRRAGSSVRRRCVSLSGAQVAVTTRTATRASSRPRIGTLRRIACATPRSITRAWRERAADQRFTTGSIEHRLIYGGRLFDDADSRACATAPCRRPAKPFRRTRSRPPTTSLAGVFVQDEITHRPLVAVSGAALGLLQIDPRTIRSSSRVPAGQDDSHVSPKLGVLFRVTEQLNLFANAAAGFKAPAPSQVNNGFTNPFAELSLDLQSGPEARDERHDRGRRALWQRQLERQPADSPATTMTSSSRFRPAASLRRPTRPIFQYVNLSGAEIYGAEAIVRSLGAGFK